MDSKLRKYLIIIALGLAGGSIYYLPFIKYTFYDAQIAAMHISNSQSAMMLTIYGIANTILYIPGGIVADKISPKWSLIISLLGTTGLGLLYAAVPTFTVGMLVWAGFSFTTAFVFWAALMKAVRIIGTEEEQGFMYGCYYACNGIAGALTSWLSLQAYNSVGGENLVAAFKKAVITGSIVPAVAAVALFFLMKDAKDKETADDNEPKFEFAHVFILLKNPVTWMISLVVLCGYGFFSSTSWFNPYLTAVRGLSIEDSALISVIRNYLLLLLAPVGGYLSDKVFKSTCKWLSVAFAILAALFLIVLILPPSISGTAASLYTLIPGAVTMAMYGVVFSTVSEAGIPRIMTGTIIGVASIIGYMPDTIYNMLFGYWLDAFGNAGYNYIFIFLAATGVFGAIMAGLIRVAGKKYKIEVQCREEDE